MYDCRLIRPFSILILALIIGSTNVVIVDAEARQRAPAEIPESESADAGIAIRSTLAEELIRLGVIRVASDLADLPIEFRVLDEDGLWLPHSNVVLDFGEEGRIRLGTTDADGRIMLAFSEDFLMRDPRVIGELDGSLHGVHFRFTAPVDRPPPQVVSPEAQRPAQPVVDPGFPPASSVLITGGQWFDVQEGVFRPNQGILVVNGRFLSIDFGGDVPEGSFTLELDDDQYILPGIVDLHAHYNVDFLGEGRVDETIYNPLIYLANGVATTFTAGEYDPHEMLEARDRIARGEQIGPRILLAGPYFGRSNPAWNNDYSEDDIHALVDEWAARGVAGFKAKGASPEHLYALIRRAHEHGFTVTGHLDSGFRGTTNSVDAIRMGIDRVEHILGGYVLDPEQPAYPVWNQVDTTEAGFRDIVRDFIDHHVYFSATLTAPVYFGSPDETEGFDDWADEQSFFTPYVREQWEQRRDRYTGSALMDDLHRTMLRTTKAFFDAGGGHLITLGTDKPSWGEYLAGFGAHREIHAIVRAGIPEADALRIATLNGANAINQGNLLGSIETGKLADLVIIRGDPLDDITNTRNVDAVMKSGRLYDPVRLLDAARGRIGPAGEDEREAWGRQE